MKHQPLALNNMTQCGSSLLRALQNESMVPLDLLVRESVQNSLDAAEHEAGSVLVDFSIRKHHVDDVAGLLEGCDVAGRLRARFRGPQRLLEIRDGRTVGLTGPLRVQQLQPGESHGNLLKLVYEVGRSQEREAAGGSWGLGKTVYFRMGIGLVFFYSRIRMGQGFAERLAACFVEDETQKERIQNTSATGIAWWGSDGGPLVHDADVAQALSSLNARRYVGDETGTAVIIPFLRDDLRPRTGSNGDGEADDTHTAAPETPWGVSDVAYIRAALQRWYCARLQNRHFRGGPYLDASVDGERVTFQTMLPVFQIAQCLYNRMNAAPSTPDALDHIAPGAEVRVEEVGPLRLVVENSTSVGKLAMARLTPDQLGMSPPRNQLSPFMAIYGRDAVAPFAPVVAFMRTHGMVVRWDNRSDARGWSKGVPSQEDSYLLAVFVPDGRKALHSSLRRRLKRGEEHLEAYLRSCEMADHHQWSDPAGITVVSRTRERVAEKLRTFVSPQEAAGGGAVPLLAARTIADALLPAGFGSDGRNGAPITSRPQPETPRPSSGLPSLEISRVQHSRGKVEFDWKLTWSRTAAPCILRLEVDSEARPLSRCAWRKDAAGDFPLAIVGNRLAPSSGSSPFASEVIEDGSAISIRPPGKSRATRAPASVAGTTTIRISPPPGGAVQALLSVAPSPSAEGTAR